MLGEHATNYIFVDINAEGMSDLLGNTHTAKARIAALHLNDRHNEFRRGSFGARFTPAATRAKELPILSIHQGPVELEQRCRLDQRAKLRYPMRAYEQRGQSENEAVKGREIRRSLPRTIANEQLMLQQQGLGDDGAQTARSEQLRKGDQ